MSRIGNNSHIKISPLIIGSGNKAEKTTPKTIHQTNDKAVQDALYALGTNAKAGIKKIGSSSPAKAFSASPNIQHGIGQIGSDISQFGPTPFVKGIGSN